MIGRSKRRTRGIRIALHLSLCAGVGWWESRGVRLIVRAFRTLCWHLLAYRLLAIHRLLLVALWRWWVLTRLLLLLLLRRVGIAVLAVLWKRLAIRAVQLRVRRRVLAAIDRMRGYERLERVNLWTWQDASAAATYLSLGAHGREDTLLREALAIGAATILGLVEA